MQAADTGISKSTRACLPWGLANHLAYVQHLDLWVGQVLGQTSRPSQTECCCWAMCCLKAGISMMAGLHLHPFMIDCPAHLGQQKCRLPCWQ